MTNMPDEGATDPQRHSQQTARPDVPPQAGPAAPPPSAGPGRRAGGPSAEPEAAGGPVIAGRPGGVDPAATRVTGRRIVQYIVDYILAGIVPALAYWLFDTNARSIYGFRWVVATIIALAAYFLYWVAIPYWSGGQTFGMKLFRLRVISKDGSPASKAQLFVRAIFLIVDTLVFGIVGLITILASQYRQRVGDHVARTVVVPAHYRPGL